MDSMRPRAREGHHDPRQEHRRPARRARRSTSSTRPGHADFGGEVERGLTMVDGVLLLVDASEGPLPQTRFVLRKALEARPAGRARREQGRPARRARRGGRRRGLRALPRPRRERVADRVPDRLRERARGQAGLDAGRARADLGAALRHAARDDPAAVVRPRATRCRRSSRTSTRARTSAGSRSCASTTARSARAQQIAWCRADGDDRERARDASSTSRRRSTASPPTRPGPGEIVALAGLPEVTIGETIADPDDPRPLPVTTVDEPSLSITIGINTSPLAGTEGDKADREPGQAAARPGARRQRLAARAPDLAARMPGRCRAAASCSSRCSSS